MIVACAGVSLTEVQPASAATQWTAAHFVSWSMSGRDGTLGPNYYTDYGKAVITGWPDRIANNTKVSPSIKITNSGSPVAPMNQRATHYAPDGSYHPDTWYNPFSWDWGHILGSMWQHLKDCLSGAAGAFLPSMGGTLAVNLLIHGGPKLYVGPAGYAAIAVGGCLGKIMG